MNKGITLIILLVVFTAMGLVMFSHIGAKEESAQPQPSAAEPRTAPTQGGFANPLQAPQGDAGNLRSIEPPLSNGRSALPMPPGSDGTPQPVRLTPASDGRPPQPVVLAPAEPGETDPGRGSEAPGQPAAPAEAARMPSSTASAATQSTGDPKPAASTLPAAQPSEAKPQSQPTPSAEKPASGSPVLTPWKKPPQEAQSASTRPSPQTAGQTPAQSAGQAPAQSAARTSAQTPQPSSNKHSLRNISLASAGQGMQLQIEADGPFTCNAFVLTGPDRLVVDLPGSWTGMRKPNTPQNTLIKNVRLGQQPSGPRLVLDLAGPLKGHKVERSGGTTRIIMQ